MWLRSFITSPYSDGFIFNKLIFRNGSNIPEITKASAGVGYWLRWRAAPSLRVRHRPTSVNETGARTPAALLGGPGRLGAKSHFASAALGASLLARLAACRQYYSGSRHGWRAFGTLQRVPRRFEAKMAIVRRRSSAPTRATRRSRPPGAGLTGRGRRVAMSRWSARATRLFWPSRLTGSASRPGWSTIPAEPGAGLGAARPDSAASCADLEVAARSHGRRNTRRLDWRATRSTCYARTLTSDWPMRRARPMCCKAICEEARWRIEAHGRSPPHGPQCLAPPATPDAGGRGPLAGYADEATRSGVDDHALIVDDRVLVLAISRDRVDGRSRATVGRQPRARYRRRKAAPAETSRRSRRHPRRRLRQPDRQRRRRPPRPQPLRQLPRPAG